MFQYKNLGSDEQAILEQIKGLEARKHKIEDLAATRPDDKVVQDAFIKGRNKLDEQMIELSNELGSIRRGSTKTPIISSHQQERVENLGRRLHGDEITKESYDNLQAKIAKLEDEKIEIMERKRKAAAEGDRSENAAYSQAVGDARRNETLLGDARRELALARVVDLPTSTDKIDMGTLVSLRNLATKDEVEYTIVGKNESNPEEGKISYLSKVGAALIGKRVGDVASISLPNGNRIDYKVIGIELRRDNV